MKKLKYLFLLIFTLLTSLIKGDTTTVQNIKVPVNVTINKDSTIVTITKTIHDTIKVPVYIHDTIYITVKDTVKPVDTLIVSKDTINRGMYVSGLKSIAGVKASEDALITNLNKYKTSTIYWYSIDGATDAYVTSLFKRIRKETKVNDIGATASSANTFLNTRLKWNTQHVDSAKYNSFNYELEPWNQVDKASAWATNASYLQQTRKDIGTSKVLLTDYFGWWNDISMVNVPDTLAKYLDFCLIHDYRVKPDFAYMKTRCDNLNTSYKKLNKIGKVRPIGSAEPSFLGPWLAQGHTLDEWYKLIYADFTAQKYTNLIMDGYVFFTMDFVTANSTPPNARIAKPLILDPKFINETTKGHMQYIEPDSTQSVQ
tara:strand:+ start:69156 stop:70268 length:1113 start_codon:yes stop_codon:yes gene_type:complete